MSLSLVYHELARADLYAAWSWCEARERGLGDRFIAAVDAALDQVAVWPHSGSPTIEVDGEVVERRVGTAGFPYLGSAPPSPPLRTTGDELGTTGETAAVDQTPRWGPCR